jgi:hypothetical protein
VKVCDVDHCDREAVVLVEVIVGEVNLCVNHCFGLLVPAQRESTRDDSNVRHLG